MPVTAYPEEAQLLKEKSGLFHSVSHYILSAVQEFSNVDVKERIELIRELGEFYRKNQNELSWAGGNLNQVVKRANELAVAWLLAPSYSQEIVLPTIRETQETMNRIKRDLELITLKCIKNKTLK
ncbi:hypothetical protein DWX51_04250 [Bacteroides uniformis]|uniref:hypothetical protein n=1 Tax=Bacteroides sp. TaxID=29523 RepID=UPI000E4A2894|nr:MULTISPECIES: hypothetical protein [Bacteroides]MBF7062541.1 hypothetical protein [Bacteroides sp. HF-5613]MBV3827787.1 hypothetical protein [Bacteroides uniformis]QPH59716.1 hypothetical protein ITJ87_11445 [Bacteroides sp. HF-162]RGJ49909.1 hypothetical protein DXD58_12405 [Bacteroides sp. D20]RGT16004.1 hypothetical protein DWX51_04250 [Bacteroides uniformis]